jgi:hypothetical protein
MPPCGWPAAGSRGVYYFSGGRRIPLRADPDWVAVLLDHPAVRATDLPVQLERQGHVERSGVVVVPHSVLPERLRSGLEAQGALLPVYAHGDAQIVVLPEVRVEGSDTKQVAAIHGFLDSADVETEVIEERGNQVTLRPRSGRAEDALRLANEIHERLHPPMAQARFLRIVRKR